MKIRFEIDKNYDAETFVFILQSSNQESYSHTLKVDPRTISKIRGGKLKDINKFTKLVDETYDKCLPYIEKSREIYQESWDGIIDDFSGSVEKLTTPWFYKEYICVVTHFLSGVSNQDGNVIARNWMENPFTQRRITAHEIILAHYFSIHKNNYPDSKLEQKQVWALGEIAALALTGLEPELKKFWPWDTQGYYTDHNYPELVELQLMLKEPFLKRKSFDEYIKAGIEAIRKEKTL